MMKKTVWIGLCVLAGIFPCLAAMNPANAPSSLPVLVSGAESGAQMFSIAPPAASDPHETRMRVVEVDAAFLPQAAARQSAMTLPAASAAPERVVLELFPDVVVTGIVQRAETHASGVSSLYGTLTGRDGGRFNLTSHNGILLGSVMPANTNGLVYHIRFRKSLGNVQVVTETDTSGLHFTCGTCQPAAE